jgi:hypothetical protein
MLGYQQNETWQPRSHEWELLELPMVYKERLFINRYELKIVYNCIISF